MRIFVLLLAAAGTSLLAATPVRAAEDAARTAFEQKCAPCHTIGGGKRVGPDLRGVPDLRPTDWLVRWITHPDQMLSEKDPVAVQLLNESAQVPMPNLALSDSEARALIDYIRTESARQPPVATTGQSAAAAAPEAARPRVYPPPSLGPIQRVALLLFLSVTALIAAVFIGVALSTRHPQALDIHKAYGLRKAFFFVVAAAVLVALAATLGRTPYAAVTGRADRIVYVTARQFDFVFSLEPIVSVEDLSRVATLRRLELPAGAAVEFRVTALDVNHNFALYGPQRRLLAQTQAMPGYVNRLRVRLTAPGLYPVLCLEYCGAAHHLMQTEVSVR